MQVTGYPPHPGIYRITNILNKKTYIGQTISIRAHLSHHLSKLIRGVDYNPPLQASWNKYGKDAFECAVVELCENDKDILTKLEQKHIDAIPIELRFNIKPAGPSGSLGIRQPDDQKLKHSRSKGGRPFYVVHNVTGEVLRFEHVGEAITALPGLQRAHIYSCLHGLRLSHAGYTFDYDPDVPAVAPKYKASGKTGANEHSRAIESTNVETGEVRVYDYVAQTRAAGFITSGVYLCLAGGMRQHKGHTWRYLDGLPHRSKPASPKQIGARVKHGGSRPIIGIHKYTGEVVRFDYIRQAATALGLAPTNISSCLSPTHRAVTAGGYAWKYAD